MEHSWPSCWLRAARPQALRPQSSSGAAVLLIQCSHDRCPVTAAVVASTTAQQINTKTGSNPSREGVLTIRAVTDTRNPFTLIQLGGAVIN